MPAEHHMDPTWLDVVSAQLARSSTAALEASHELLAHYSDTGDATTQQAVDALVNQTSDALETLADSLADASRTLRAAVEALTRRGPTTSNLATCQRGAADGSVERSGRTLDQGV